MSTNTGEFIVTKKKFISGQRMSIPGETLDVDRIVTDVDYVVSDLHLNHQNIINYCRDERFEFSQSGLDAMNWELLSNWNETVSSDERVLFLGDFSWVKDDNPENRRKVTHLATILNGEKVFLRGDHDHVKPDSVRRWDYSAIIRHRGREYLATHFPGDTPSSIPGEGMPAEFERRLPTEFESRWDGWRLHGHHHNNWLERYPLANPDHKTINCSVELTGYRPLAMDEVHRLVEEQAYVDHVSLDHGGA